MFAGMTAHLAIGPLLGVSVGGIGAVIGKHWRLSRSG